MRTKEENKTRKVFVHITFTKDSEKQHTKTRNLALSSLVFFHTIYEKTKERNKKPLLVFTKIRPGGAQKYARHKAEKKGNIMKSNDLHITCKRLEKIISEYRNIMTPEDYESVKTAMHTVHRLFEIKRSAEDQK